MAARILEIWTGYTSYVHFAVANVWLCTGFGTTHFGLEKKQKDMSLRQRNIPVKVDEKTLSLSQRLVEEEIKSGTAPGGTDALLRPPFVTVGSEVEGIGSLKNRNGAIVGIPYSWRYSAKEDVEFVNIALHRKAGSVFTWWMTLFNDYVYALPKSSKYDIITTKYVHCDVVATIKDSSAMDALKESLILSENAKTFAYSREIAFVNTYHQNVMVGIGALSIGMGGTFGYVTLALSQAFKTPVKSGRILPFVVLAHAVAYSVSLNWFKNGMDLYLSRRDARIDLDLVEKGLTEGGVEYYEKLIQKNISIRTLLGSEGEQLYSEDGNVIYPNKRKPHLSLTELRDNLVRLKTYV